MAATRGYFEDNTLNVQNGDTTDKVLIPTHLAEYGSTTDQIATKFKLDIVLPHHAGFLGGIKVSGSNNLAYHNTHNKNIIDGSANSKGDDTSNPNRLSKLRIYKDGTEYALFNDGGVNTKPECKFKNISNITNTEPFLLWAAYPKGRVGATFSAARFVNTTNRVISTGTSSSVIDSADNGAATQGTSESFEQILDCGALTEGQSVTLTISTTNAEGTITKTMTGSVGPAVDLPYLWNYYDSDIFAPSSPTMIMSLYKFTDADLDSVTENDSATGIHLYTDDRMNRAVTTVPNTPPDGWYNTAGNKYYKVVSGEVRYYKTRSEGTTKKCAIVPCIIGKNIGIEITNVALTGSVTVNSIIYYDSATATNQEGAQTINKTISNLALGTRIDTGLAINKQGDYARFSLSSTAFDNPITMLMNMDFDEQA